MKNTTRCRFLKNATPVCDAIIHTAAASSFTMVVAGYAGATRPEVWGISMNFILATAALVISYRRSPKRAPPAP